MKAEPVLPDMQTLLREFAERHQIQFTELVEREKIAIHAVCAANILVNQGYVQLNSRALRDPAVGLLLQLLHRNVEHAEASIVAFVSGCGSSAEVVARAVVEASVNVLYILVGDRTSRLWAYFHNYFDGVDRQVELWRAEAGRLGTEEAKSHYRGVEQRGSVNDLLRRRITDLIGHKPKERWPSSIQQRFREIGDAIGYRTFYARMSSETHADAEETLRYFMAKVAGNPRWFEAMALETVWFTRFLIHYGVQYFVRASLQYAQSYSLPGIVPLLKTELSAVESELAAISAHVGAGI